MGLVLRTSAAHAPLKLRGGAVWHLRPANAIDLEIAAVRAGRQLAGLIAGSEAAAALREVFGAALDLGEADEERTVAVTRLLGDIHLAVMCSAGWEGVYDERGHVVPEPTIEWVAMMLADGVVLRRVRERIYSDLHEESEEKKELPPSPHGVAPAADAHAPPAAPPASRAH